MHIRIVGFSDRYDDYKLLGYTEVENMHDLLEDTNYNPKGLPENFTNALKILTKAKEVSYDDYCKSIKSVCHINYRKCAYWVKLADMKDHLSLIDTLTDRLKEKYLSGLRYLL